MAEALKPGIKCSDIYKLGAGLLKEADVTGISSHIGGRMGHGQGMMVTEPPSITSDDDTVLEPGFVLSTEPGLGDGIFIWEDVHVRVHETPDLKAKWTDAQNEVT